MQTYHLYDQDKKYTSSKKFQVGIVPKNGTTIPVNHALHIPLFNGAEWVEAPTITNIFLTINTIDSDDVNDSVNSNELTCTINSTVTIDVTTDIPITETFRVPVTNDTETRYTLANFVDGTATISTTIDKSGLWTVTQENVNHGMPEDTQFNFEPIKIYVVQ